MSLIPCCCDLCCAMSLISHLISLLRPEFNFSKYHRRDRLTRLRAGAVRLRSTSKVRALPAHAGAPPAHQLSQAQRQWSVLPRAAEACAPCLRRRLTGAAHSAPRPRTCDHHLEQARWPQPTCTSHASALCTRISSPVLLLMTVRHRCVCRGPRTTCTSGRAARCSASAWSLSMTIFLNDCALRCARAARGLRLLQT